MSHGAIVIYVRTYVRTQVENENGFRTISLGIHEKCRRFDRS